MWRRSSIPRASATVALGLLVLLQGVGLASRETEAVDSPLVRAPLPASAPRPPELRTWEDLRRDATHLLGRRVRFVVQFERRLERWSSYCSRFGPGDFGAFQAWADEQMPWRVEDYEAPRVRLFVRRGSAVEECFGRDEPYARFEIEGTVRELFLGEPWIEVEVARELPEHLTEGSVIHAGRALSLMEEGSWTLACTELDVALQPRLPAAARAELERLKQVCGAAAEMRSGTTQGGRPQDGAARRLRTDSARAVDG